MKKREVPEKNGRDNKTGEFQNIICCNSEDYMETTEKGTPQLKRIILKFREHNLTLKMSVRKYCNHSLAKKKGEYGEK